MNKVLQVIYCELTEKSLPNKLETAEMLKKQAEFSRKVTEDFGLDSELQDIISEYQEKAFSAGFYTAVELLTGGGQK